MFAYNDGKLHENVEVVGDFTPIELTRVANTTQYVINGGLLRQFRHSPVEYQFRVDNTLGEKLLNDFEKFWPRKRNWQDTNYIQVTPEELPETLIYILPGNPGICEFYYEFVEAMARLVPGSEVVAISYQGYNLNTATPNSGVVGLQQQIDHKVRFLQYLKDKRPPKQPYKHIILLGHSVGAWIAQRVATIHSDIGFVGLLAPTIKDIAKSDRGRMFVRMTRYIGPGSLYWAVKGLTYIPFSGLMASTAISMLLPQGEVSQEAREVANQLVKNPSVTSQIVGMAIEEMNRIGSDIEPKEIQGFWDSKRVWECFAKEDHWVSPETTEALLDFAKSKPNVQSDIAAVPHAFCLKHNEAVAGLAAVKINEWLESE